MYKELIKKILTYHPSTDISMIEKAYKVASKAHEGQLRKSGEPYIMHPLCVAIILAELELDKETIVAGILHDVVEDTVMTSEEIAAEFSEEVAFLVEVFTKLTQLKMTTGIYHAVAPEIFDQLINICIQIVAAILLHQLYLYGTAVFSSDQSILLMLPCFCSSEVYISLTPYRKVSEMCRLELLHICRLRKVKLGDPLVICRILVKRPGADCTVLRIKTIIGIMRGDDILSRMLLNENIIVETVIA